MRKIFVILSLLICLYGCKDTCVPCLIKEGDKVIKGFAFCFLCGLGNDTHCVPCSEAKSPEARYICFGETK